jgi:hypothetical protein
MDFFQSHQTVPKPLLSYLLPFSRTFNCTSKTTGWFTSWNDPNPYANKVLLKVAHILIHWWTSFSRTKLCPSRCYLTFFHFPERSIALVKRLAGSPRAEIDRTCPTLTKCYSKVAHAFLYTLMDFFQSHQTVPKPLLSYLLPFSRTFNCTSKTTGWFTKGLKWSNPHANKVLLKVARILIYIDGLLSVAPNCAPFAILPSSIFPNVQLH